MAAWSGEGFRPWYWEIPLSLRPLGPPLKRGQLSHHYLSRLVSMYSPPEFNLIQRQVACMTMVPFCSLCGRRLGQLPNDEIFKRNDQFLRHWRNNSRCQALRSGWQWEAYEDKYILQSYLKTEPRPDEAGWYAYLMGMLEPRNELITTLRSWMAHLDEELVTNFLLDVFSTFYWTPESIRSKTERFDLMMTRLQKQGYFAQPQQLGDDGDDDGQDDDDAEPAPASHPAQTGSSSSSAPYIPQPKQGCRIESVSFQ